MDELIEELRRDRARRATMEVVGELGYIRASVPAICKAAAMGFRTFRRLYASKEEAFLDAYMHAAGDLLRASAGAYDDCPGELRERVTAGVEHALNSLSAEPLLAQALIVQAPAAGLPLLESRAIVLQRLASWLDDALGNEPAPGGVTVAAEFAVGGALWVLYTCVSTGRLGEMHEMVDAIVALLVRSGAVSAAA